MVAAKNNPFSYAVTNGRRTRPLTPREKTLNCKAITADLTLANVFRTSSILTSED